MLPKKNSHSLYLEISFLVLIIIMILTGWLFVAYQGVNILGIRNEPNSKQVEITATPSLAMISKYLDYTVITETPIPSPTPLPTATPKPKPLSVPELDSLFSKYSNHYSIDKNLLAKIAACESGFNSNAVNGVYAGIFQFSPSAWIITRNMMSMDPNPDLRHNAEESIKTAAFKLSVSGISFWPNCSR